MNERKQTSASVHQPTLGEPLTFRLLTQNVPPTGEAIEVSFRFLFFSKKRKKKRRR
jgi:hypothetical protein